MEDFQPNESRGIPKGRGIPTIRSTAPRYRTPFVRGRPGFIAGTRHRSGNLTRQPTAASSTISSSSILPQPGGRSILQTSTDPITTDEPGPSKRRKFIGTRDVGDYERRPEHAKLPPKAKSKSKVHTDSFDLPPYCWKGATNSRDSRREFIEQFIEGFVKANGAIVLQHTVQDQKLYITYRLLAEKHTQQHMTQNPSQTSKDRISNSSWGFQIAQHANPDGAFTPHPHTSDIQRRNLHSVHIPGHSSTTNSSLAGSLSNPGHRVGDELYCKASSHYTRAPDQSGQLSHPLATEFISVNQTEGSDVERLTRRPSHVQEQLLNTTLQHSQLLDHIQSSYVLNTHSLHFNLNSPRMFRSGIIVVNNDEVTAKNTTQPQALGPSDATKDAPSPSERSNLVKSCNSVTLTSSKAGTRANTGMSDLHLSKLQPSRSSPLFSGIFRTNGEITRLPRETSDKARRLLHSYNSGNHYLVTLHGSVHGIARSHLSRHFSVRVTPASGGDRIDDACILNLPGRDIAVIGQSREECPLSITHLDDDKKARFVPLERQSEAEGKMRGVSCVSALPQRAMFATGGYDHIVHLWTLNDNLASATSSKLHIEHTSTVQSLLPLHNRSSQLLSAGADRRVNVWDIPSERRVNELNTSNSVYHLHSMPDVGCVCLEIANLHLQFELHDYRLVPERPVQRFGYHSAQFHGRFIKGATNANLFACGDRNGAIRLWDMRKTNQLLQTISCFPGIKVTQVVFDQSDLVVCAEDNSFMRLKQLSVGT